MADPERAGYAALVAALYCGDNSTTTQVDPIYGGSDLERLRDLLFGKGPLTPERVSAVHFEMAHRLGKTTVKAHEFRTTMATMRHPRNGTMMVAKPLYVTKRAAHLCIDQLVEEANVLIADPPSDGFALCEAVGVLISKFLRVHVYVDCNGRLAEALIAAIIYRATGTIIHIGAHGGDNYKDWCAAVMEHQRHGNTAALTDILWSALVRARLDAELFAEEPSSSQ